MERVVITGMGGICALGDSWTQIEAAFDAGRNAVRLMPDWDCYEDLNTRLAARCHPSSAPTGPASSCAAWGGYRNYRSTPPNGRWRTPACLATQRSQTAAWASPAIVDRQHGRRPRLRQPANRRHGQQPQREHLCTHDAAHHRCKHRHFLRFERQVDSYFQRLHIGQPRHRLRLRSHPPPPPGADAGGWRGGTVPERSHGLRCTVCHEPTQRRPALTPRPYDSARDGLVVGEGAGMLVLEALSHARARGARIHAELIGFGCNSDGTHITRPEAATMRIAMEQALADARLPASAIGYVNGHGTATEHGDIAETRATHALFGDSVMISSQKSYLGHTLGACGWRIVVQRRNAQTRPLCGHAESHHCRPTVRTARLYRRPGAACQA